VLPIAVTVPLFGVSFGVLARAADMGVVAPIVMSATTFAGGAQFAVASILDEGGGLAAAIVAALLLNARYAAIGIAVASIFRGPRLRRLLESQLIVDESWALSARPDGTFDRRVLLGAGLALYVTWVLGTALGVLGGGFLGDPERLGLDARVGLLISTLLAALVVTQTFGTSDGLSVDARLVGVGAAAVALALRTPLIVAVALAAVATAATRAFT
jgi:4-azaleucine resistance transporter AzlC